MDLQIVNTVNTELNNSYDFGIHAYGCADVARVEKRFGVEVYSEFGVESPEAYIAEDEADFAAQGQTSFAYKVFPCCKKLTPGD